MTIQPAAASLTAPTSVALAPGDDRHRCPIRPSGFQRSRRGLAVPGRRRRPGATAASHRSASRAQTVRQGPSRPGNALALPGIWCLAPIRRRRRLTQIASRTVRRRPSRVRVTRCRTSVTMGVAPRAASSSRVQACRPNPDGRQELCQQCSRLGPSPRGQGCRVSWPARRRSAQSGTGLAPGGPAGMACLRRPGFRGNLNVIPIGDDHEYIESHWARSHKSGAGQQ